ncbi:hypothetical protein CS542_06525 [Pedobacter sp. IW39]|nr:hypothetical protein CS542_06525 [Pedobacter sp. IW39]
MILRSGLLRNTFCALYFVLPAPAAFYIQRLPIQADSYFPDNPAATVHTPDSGAQRSPVLLTVDPCSSGVDFTIPPICVVILIRFLVVHLSSR